MNWAVLDGSEVFKLHSVRAEVAAHAAVNYHAKSRFGYLNGFGYGRVVAGAGKSK